MVLATTHQSRTSVEAVCVCGQKQIISRRFYKKNLARHGGNYLCRTCVVDPGLQKRLHSDPLYRAAMSRAVAKKWEDPNYRKLVTDRNKNRSQDPKYRAKMEMIWKSKEFRDQRSEVSRRIWQNPEYRKKMEAVWASKSYKVMMAQKRATYPTVSSTQETLYSLLDDLGVKFFREREEEGKSDLECTIGPYNFDCVIPRTGKPTLLVECQGDWFHIQPENVARDKRKAAYITNNFQGIYELKCIWEHEFKCLDKINTLLKYWLDIAQPDVVDFDFSSIVIKRVELSEYRKLLEKYHYIQGCGRGGVAFGAYLNDVIVAVCVFSPLVRQNISISGFKEKEVRELSRLCIHPSYQKKNFGSWFISRCIKMLDKKYRCIIAYTDTTFNHIGTVYKAANFDFDVKVSPDYWYVSNDGWIMHKKTLYNHAQRVHMRENDFAEARGYKQIHGKEKLRFIFRR